jgi:hypothetical protein
MAHYRLYFMHRFSGHIGELREFFADDDAAALRIAERCCNGQPMELWGGAHKLKHWKADPEGAPIPASS